MRRKLLIAGGIACLLLVTLVLAGPALLRGPVRDAVTRAAADSLDADLAFQGVSLSLLRAFPSVSVRLDEVAITGRGPHADVKLLELEQLDLAVDLASLFGGPVRIERIGLVRPRVHLVQPAEGRPNWEITRPKDPPSAPSEPGTLPELALDEVSIRGGSLTLRDAASGVSVDLDALSFDGRADLSAARSRADAKLAIGSVGLGAGARTLLEDSRFAIELVADVDQEAGLLTLAENRIQLDALALTSSGTVTLPPDGLSVLDLRFTADSPSIASLISLVPGLAEGALDGMTTDGTLALTGTAKGPVGGDALPALVADLTVKDGSYSHAQLPEPLTDIQVAMHVASPGPDLDALVVDLSRFDARLAGNPLHLAGRLSKPLSELMVSLEARGDVDLAQLGALIPRQHADALRGRLDLDVAYTGSVLRLRDGGYVAAAAKGRIELERVAWTPQGAALAVELPRMKVGVTPETLRVDELQVQVGRTDLSGTGRIDNALAWALLGDELTGSLKTTSKTIDLDELVAAFGAEGGDDPATRPGTPGTAPPSALRLPAGVDVSLDSRADALTFSSLPMRDARVRVRVVERALRIEEIGVGVLGGRVGLKGTYDSKPLQPLADVALALSRIDVAQAMEQFPALSKLAPVARSAVGTVSTDLSMVGTLDEGMNLVLDSLSGVGELVAHQLTIKGSETLSTIGAALKNARFDNASLDGVAAHFQVEDGQIKVRPFALALGPIKGTFGGSHQFDQDIAYDMDLLLPAKEFTGAASNALAGLAKGTPFAGKTPALSDTVRVGVDIRGNVRKPIVTLDLKGLAAGAADVLEQVLDVAAEELVKVADDAIGAGKAAADAALAQARAAADKARKDAYKLADRAKKQGYEAADRLIAEAKNPMAKLAAQTAAGEAKKQADKAFAEARKKADQEYAASLKKADAEYEAAVVKGKQGVADAPGAVKSRAKKK